jgi:hypothetical protein
VRPRSRECAAGAYDASSLNSAAEAVSKALNDAHDATTIGTGRNLGPGLSFRIRTRRLAVIWRCPLMIEKIAAKGELGSAMAVGHEAQWRIGGSRQAVYEAESGE